MGRNIGRPPKMVSRLLGETSWLLASVLVCTLIAWVFCWRAGRSSAAPVWQEYRVATIGVKDAATPELSGGADEAWSRSMLERFGEAVLEMRLHSRATFRELRTLAPGFSLAVVVCELSDPELNAGSVTGGYLYRCRAGWPAASHAAEVLVVGDPGAGTVTRRLSTGDLASLLEARTANPVLSPVWPAKLGFAMPFAPLWTGLAANCAALIATARLGLYGLKQARRAFKARRGRCPTCGYPVRGLAACPECGEGIEGSGTGGLAR